MMPVIGKNIALMAKVAINIGEKSSWALAVAASRGDIPRERWSM